MNEWENAMLEIPTFFFFFVLVVVVLFFLFLLNPPHPLLFFREFTPALPQKLQKKTHTHSQ